MLAALALLGCQSDRSAGHQAQPDVRTALAAALDAGGDLLRSDQLSVRKGAVTGVVPSVVVIAPSIGTTMQLPDGPTPFDPPASPTINVQVAFSVANFSLAPGANRVHVYLDGVKVGTRYGTAPFEVVGVGHGGHRLALILADAAGQELGHPEARATTAFKVTRVCLYDLDCDDANQCNLDRCLPVASKPGWRNCAYGPDPSKDTCCNHRFDCPVGDLCHQGQCIDCLVDGDCDDGRFCTIDQCASNICVHTWKTGAQFGSLAFCCEGDLDCNDGDACTADACNPVTNSCTNAPTANPLCCNTNIDCDDENVCNLDRCITNVCRHGPGPDPNCCNTSTDCNDLNPCTVDVCNQTTNQCEFTVAQTGNCCNLSSECIDGDPKTVDWCQEHQCQHVIPPNYCEATAQPGTIWYCGDDGNTCTADVCANNLCQHPPIDGCCLVDPDCKDGNPCTLDSCVQNLCAHANKPGCCLSEGDCADGNACSLDRCIGNTCRHGPDPSTPRPCCNADADCDDRNACTTETCNPDHSCTFVTVQAASCCTEAADCDDGDPFTLDSCVQHKCLHKPTGSCTVNAHCDDGNPCTTEFCTAGQCQSNTVVGCCAKDLHCNDGDSCTTDLCTGNTCSHTPIAGCCTSAADCNDGNPCNEDYCVGGSCRHTPVQSGCCLSHLDCDDGNSCTEDVCHPTLKVCTYTIVPGPQCCETQAECYDGDPCTKDICAGHTCYHTLIGSCCSTDADCDDKKLCTTDRCIFGTCKHLPPNPAAGVFATPDVCCTVDADCPDDGSPCTIESCDPGGFCRFDPSPTCTYPLPYLQPFDAFKPWIWYGWTPTDLPGGWDTTKNWIVTTAGALGPDGHARFFWNPAVGLFDSRFVSPRLDSTGATQVTVQFNWKYTHFGQTVDVGLWASKDGNWALATPIWVDSLSTSVDPLVNFTLPAALVGSTFQLAFSVSSTSTLNLTAFDIDDFKVVAGTPPYFVKTPSSVIGLVHSPRSFALRARDDDGQVLQFSITKGPPFVSMGPTQFNSTLGQYLANLQVAPIFDTDVGNHEVQVRITDGSLDAFVTLPVTVLLNQGYAVWSPSGVPPSHAAALESNIRANGRKVQVVDDITLYDNPFTLKGIFVSLGVFGAKHNLSSAEIAFLQSYLDGGGHVYMEGGDVWTEAPAALTGRFAVDGLADGPQFLDGPLDGTNFLVGLSYGISPSPLLNHFLDKIDRVSKTGNAHRIIEREVGAKVRPTVIAYDPKLDPSNPKLYRTLGAARPFAALVEQSQGTLPSLMSQYLLFLEQGYPFCASSAECDDLEICTIDTCQGGICKNDFAVCVLCDDDRDCQANQACLAQGICADIPGVLHASTGPVKPIDTLPSTITVQDTLTLPTATQGGDLVQEAYIKLYLSHLWVGELRLTLSHAGKTVVLKAADSFDASTSLYRTWDLGLLPAQGSLADFVGGPASGDWVLTIEDTAPGFNGGILQRWDLFLVTSQKACTVTADCNDGNACTNEVCTSGVCVVTPVDCRDYVTASAEDLCTLDACDPATGCTHTLKDCSDTLVCTVDTCFQPTGQCRHNQVQNCNISNCTRHAECGFDDYCDYPTGLCTPIAGTGYYASGVLPLLIPDADAAGIENSIVVSNSEIVTDLFVKVYVTHTFRSDLRITLSHGGAPIALHRVDASDPADDVDAVYDYDAPYDVVGFSGVASGPAGGAWTLRAVDAVPGDQGSLQYWTVYLQTSRCIQNADCDDGNACTTDSCSIANGSGTCNHSPVVCDDGLFCNGVESCLPTAGCQPGVSPTLDDGQPCTADSCDEGLGAVVHTPLHASCHDGNPCTDDVCDPAQGCLNLPNTAGCDDGLQCTVNDTCSGGTCSGVASSAPACQCTTAAQCPEQGDKCLPDYACVGGSCVPVQGSGTVCNPGEDTTCLKNTCAPMTGLCQMSPVTAGVACDDGQPCTSNDRCDGGGGCAGSSVQCGDGVFCNGAELCNAATGGCVPGAPPSLDDGVDCTLDACNEGGDTITHTPSDALCDDGDPCTSDTCNATAGCLHSFNSAPCDDGDPCTGNDTCQGGQCTGTPGSCACVTNADCPDDGNLCNGVLECQAFICRIKAGSVVTCDQSQDTTCRKKTCIPATGSCTLQAVGQGLPCDDGDACTTGDACNASGDCVGAPKSCDDGLFCNGAETCHPLLGCQPGAAPALDDGVQCTVDLCDELADAVVHTPDNSRCTDGNGCTDDVCSGVAGCLYPANAVPCDDGDPCTAGDVCANGVCTPGGPHPACQGCLVDSDCPGFNDGNLCNGEVRCNAGTCEVVPGSPVTCDTSADTACRKAACDPSTGTCSPAVLPEGTGCSDGDTCTTGDACSAGACVGNAVPGCCNGAADCSSKVCQGQQCQAPTCTDGVQNGTETGVDCGSPCPSCGGLPSCATEQCGAGGCTVVVQSGFCLIDGVCWSDGAKNPADGCQVCDAAASSGAWSSALGLVESCDGLDNNCNGQIDEGLTQACQNACGQPGTALCDGGAFVQCSAPTLVEICGNSIDDNCNNQADESPCQPTMPIQTGFLPTFAFANGEAQASNLVTQNADGTYTQRYYGLANPNLGGQGSASAQGQTAGTGAVVVDGLAPSGLEMIIAEDLLHDDGRTARFLFQVRDPRGRPVAQGTQVGLGLSGNTVNLSRSCTTDLKGFCAIVETLPATAFDASGSVNATATVTGLPPVTGVVSTQARPAPLTLAAFEVGLELPVGPRWDPAIHPDVFDVPVYVNTGGKTLGGYDLEVRFDKNRLEAVDVRAGTATGAFDVPVHNAGPPANTTGVLKFNAINKNLASPDGKGSRIHVATIRFRPTALLAAGTVTDLRGTVRSLVDANQLPLAAGSALRFRDGFGLGPTGHVEAKAVEVRGLRVHVQDARLLWWTEITGQPDTTRIEVQGVRSDGSLVDLSADSGTSYANGSTSILTLGSGGLATARYDKITHGGWASVTVQYGVFSELAQLEVLVPKTYALELSDPNLQSIQGYPGTGKIQTARTRVIAGWVRGGVPVFSQDISALVTVTPGSGLIWDPATREISGTTSGNYLVKATGAGGVVLDQKTLAVNTAGSAKLLGLTVAAPCRIETLAADPASPTPALGSLRHTVGVYGHLTGLQQVCTLEVYGDFDDGSRMRLTGDPHLVYGPTVGGVVNVASDGAMSPRGDGLTTVVVDLLSGSQTLASGNADVRVNLPAPTGIVIGPSDFQLALNAGDPAATVKGLATSQQLKITVTFADGSSLDLTGDPGTFYDAASQDPLDVVACTSGGLCSSTGSAPGTMTLRVTVASYPELLGTTTIEVVQASGLQAEVFEAYTPLPPRVVEHTLSFIEGTSTRQDGTLQVLMTFSDGTSQDVTSHAGTVIEALAPGTTTPKAGVVSIDAAARTIAAVAPGTVDLRFANGNQSFLLPGFAVDANRESITALQPTVASGTTFSGIRNQGKTQVSAWATFADGTRRRLDGSRFITGLLSFASTNPNAATLDTGGTATIRGNETTVFSVGVDPASDVVPLYAPPEAVTVDCNLLPDIGDADLGDSSGLAYKIRTANEIFNLEGRLNAGSTALGAFDLALTYDPAVVQILDVTPGVDLGGATFNANWVSLPGTLYLNAALNPTAPPVSGPAVRAFVVKLRAVKGGPKVTAIDATIEKMVAVDAVTPIGPPTPRAAVALSGNLDPNCTSDPVYGDADDGCSFGAEDVLFIQRYLAGLESPTSQQLTKMDAFPDGILSVGDALYLSQVLARLTHFVVLEATPSQSGDADITITVIDRDQKAVTANTRVVLEVGVSANFSTLSFDSPLGLGADAGTKLALANHVGAGRYRSTLSGLPTPTEVRVTVLLTTLQPDATPIRTLAFLGSVEVGGGSFQPLTIFNVPIQQPTGCQADFDCPGHADGNLCNGEVACVSGLCQVIPGSPVTCDTSQDTLCLKSRCQPATGLCSPTPTAQGVVCNDDNACTNGDICDGGGSCSGTPIDCDDGLFCNGFEFCNAATGQCQSSGAPDPNDGITCTVDLCDEATRSIKNVPQHGACDDGNSCTDDTCDPAAGCTYADNSTFCDDGNPCTSGDTCSAGACAGTPSGTCTCTTTEDCPTDNDLCNGNLYCVGGQCQVDPASVIQCNTSSDTACRKTQCTPATGQCAPVFTQAGRVCNDDNACTQSDTCNGNGTCSGQSITCDDGQFCNGLEFCNPIVGCKAGTAPAIDDGVGCTQDFCDEVADQVKHVPSDLACDDGNPCTQDSCDAVGGCAHQNNSLACDDGEFCTINDFCQGGLCVSGGPNPDPACQCVTTADCPNDTNLCNGKLICVGGGCVVQAGSVVVCDTSADTACMKATCTPSTGLCAPLPVASGTPCSDGLNCTVLDQCDGSGACAGAVKPCDDAQFCNGTESCNETTGQCAPGTPPATNDGIACTADGCDEVNDVVVHQPDDALCQDGQFCNGAEVCDPGAGCTPGGPPACDDGNPCTANGCDSAGNNGRGACDFSQPATSCAGQPCVGAHAFDPGDDACGIDDACVGGLGGATGLCTLICGACATYRSGTVNAIIPNNTGTCLVRTLPIATGQSRIAEVNLRLDINHGNLGDLEITLFDPTGHDVRVWDNLGATAADTHSTFGTLTWSGPNTGAPICKLRGFVADGNWTLRVCDNLGGLGGQLEKVNLYVEGTATDPNLGNTCENAVDIADTVNPTTLVGETACAWNHYAGACGGTSSSERVYRIALAQPKRLTATVNADFDQVLYVRGGDAVSCGGVGSTSCIDAQAGNIGETLIAELEAGVHYLFVDGANGGEGVYQLTVQFEPLKAIGDPCAASSECLSSFCADGVCCTSACTGPCKSCTLPGKAGVCTFHDIGTDPAVDCGSCEVCSGTGACIQAANGTDIKNDCVPEALSTCGRDGFCDGGGACRLYQAPTVCTPQSCTAGVLSLDDTCDGGGICTDGGTLSCDPYTCNDGGTDCRSFCSLQSHCISTHFCDGSACQPKKPNGAVCGNAFECVSDQCVDGVCCESACGGACEACNLPGKLGACSAHAADTDPEADCALCETCNGSKACATVQGGTDPLNDCAQADPGTCGFDGFCDGAGACRLWNGATICDPQRCLSATLHPADACDGGGACVDAGSSLCTAGFMCANASGGPVAYYGFDEGLGGTALDRSGSGNDGILLGGATWSAAGQSGGALDLDGANDSVEIAHSASLDSYGVGLSIELWIQPDGLAASDQQTLAFKDGAFLLAFQGFGTKLSLGSSWCGIPDTSLAVDPALLSGTWVHVVGVFTADVAEVYVNGALLGSSQGTGTPVCHSVNKLHLGSMKGQTAFFDGRLDGTAIYDRALSPTEVFDHFTLGTPSVVGTVCRTQCALDAHCQPAFWCNAPSCAPKKPIGDTCTGDQQCQSGFCVDGFCCTGGCTGNCESCKLAGSEGTCTLIASGQDPDDDCGVCDVCDGAGACLAVAGGLDPFNECAQEPASTCGRDGQCDGGGLCRLWAAGTVCNGESCTGAVHQLNDTCDGGGLCVENFSEPCAPYVCDGAGQTCLTACANNTHCLSTHWCNTPTCVPKKPLGDPCANAFECISDFCVDGACCDTSCGGGCMACNITGSVGICTPCTITGFDGRFGTAHVEGPGPIFGTTFESVLGGSPGGTTGASGTGGIVHTGFFPIK